jgi:hypothetical protein
MQGMDCRNFRDLLDSYLSGELAVETNHGLLRHAEQCPACRSELGARRNLRALLQVAGTRERMSVGARERLRERLRTEAAGGFWSSLSRWLAVFGRADWRAPLAVAAAILLFVGGLWVLRGAINRAPESVLSQAIMDEAAGDHQTCAVKFAQSQAAGLTPARMKEKYPAYARLAETAASGAQGLTLHSVHVCSFEQREFAHLVYSRADKLISLLVTERDARALKAGRLATDDGLAAGLQHTLSGRQQVGAYQTARHVVLLVSELPEREHRALAARLAEPVSRQLREVERTIARVERRGEHK